MTDKCNTNSDCPQGFCQMMYKTDANGDSIPDTRRCVNLKKEKNMKPFKPLDYGKLCNSNNDCASGICRPEVTVENNVRKTGEKKCVIQTKKLGKLCYYNSDCKSNICETQYDSNNRPTDSRCIIIDNLQEPDTSTRNQFKTNSDQLPDSMKTAAWNGASSQSFILTETQKNTMMEGRGPITEIIVLVIEMALTLFKEIFNQVFTFLRFVIFKYIFLFISWPFVALLEKRIFSFSDKYKCKNNKNCNGQCDSKRSFGVSHKTILSIITIFFPPYGVFLHKGISGYQDILLTSVLTLLFYFPGMLYGLSVIKK